MNHDADDDLRRLFDEAASTIDAISPELTRTVITQGNKRRQTKRRGLMAAVAAVLAILVSATWQGSRLIDNSTTPADTKDHHNTSHPAALAAALPGRWEQMSTCQYRLAILADVGFTVRLGNHLAANLARFPGAVGPGDSYRRLDLSDPCHGVAPQRDFRVFTAARSTRNYPWHVGGIAAPAPNPLRTGASYHLVNDHTIAVHTSLETVIRSLPRSSIGPPPSTDGIIKVRVDMPNANTMRLRPILPPCLKPPCFAAAWAVALTNNGQLWHRID
jgi:hypothetical protein